MLYRYDMNGPRASFGCGLLLFLLGVVLLTPLTRFLIEILGWVLIVLELIALVLAALTWLLGSRRRM